MITTAAAACDDLLIPVNAPDVRQRFAQARQSGLRAKEAAESMGLPEGAAIGAHAGLHDGGLQVVPLRAQWLQVLRALQDCGTVMALTRNESTVHEKTGVYQKLSASGGVGLALGREIDLRLFFAQWHAGYAVTEQPAQAGRPATHSLQFFNAHGRAVHKVHARESTDMAAWDALVRRFAEPSAGYLFRHARPRALPQSDKVIDVHGLSAAWDALQDTHEFFDLLRRFGVERQQAFRLVPGHCARLAPESVAQLLGDAAVDGLPIMVFVDSGGCIQIHTGPVHNTQPMGTPGGAQWINVLDPGFNLHLRCDMIASVWAVQKPTADGVVTSVEAFDAQGDLMAMFFGERKPGLAELPGWRELVAGLPRLAVQTLA
ncbi:hemin-degrading factor [Delftia tsuruhatensis]|uniref:hemin-degrading factor n=1 Tax=Delftia tsuruhatensis TaxID=180282 RepID=UPI00370B7CB5